MLPLDSFSALMTRCEIETLHGWIGGALIRCGHTESTTVRGGKQESLRVIERKGALGRIGEENIPNLIGDAVAVEFEVKRGIIEDATARKPSIAAAVDPRTDIPRGGLPTTGLSHCIIPSVNHSFPSPPNTYFSRVAACSVARPSCF